MRLWYLSHRQPAKAQVSLCIHAVSPEPSLFAHMKYGSRWRVPNKNQTSRPTGWLHMRIWRMSLRRTKSAISHELAQLLKVMAGRMPWWENIDTLKLCHNSNTSDRSSLIRVYTVCNFICIFWANYSVVKQYYSNFRIITAIFRVPGFLW